MTDMSRDANSSNQPVIVHEESSKSSGWVGMGLLALALAAVFGGSLYQSNKLSNELTAVKRQLMQSDHQISDLQGQLGTTTADVKREASETVAMLNSELEKTRKDALLNSQRAQASARTQAGKVMTELTAKNTELNDQIDQLKKDNTAKSSEVDQTISGIKGDVGDVKTEVATNKADLDNTRTDLRRAM